jgi:hypothetical protein
MNDLIEMMNAQGPASAGWERGEKEFQTQRESDLAALFKQQEINKQQQDYAKAMQMNPLDIQYRQGQVSEQGAKLPGEQATSRKLGTEADIAEAGKTGSIAATRAEQLSKISTAQVKQISDMGHAAGMLGTQLESTDPSRHDEVKRQFMSENNIHPNSTIGQYILKNGPEKLQDTSKKISALRDEYIQHMATTKATTESQERLEKARIEAGKYKKGTTVSYTMKFMSMPIDRQNAEIAAAMATGKSPISGEPMDDEEKASLTARFQQNKATLDAQIAARSAPGIVPQTSGTGGISLQNKPIPQTGSLGGAPKPALPAGWTMK